MGQTSIFVVKFRPRIAWLFTMAWRDTRRNRPKLFLFLSSIIFGIAALVAVSTFGYNLNRDADSQAATLIGADLSISSNKSVDGALHSLIDSLGDRRSLECSFVSMVYFPSDSGTRLVQVRALQGEFPYYGNLGTIPRGAGKDFRKGKMALVDQTLLLLFHAKVNDSISILRCLGAKGYEAFLIYLIQIAGIGLMGSVIGSFAGTLIQHALPLIFREFLPVSISAQTYWPAIGQGVVLGLTISVLFALLPLITIRLISPLNTLRLVFEPVSSRRDPLRWLVYLLIVGFIILFSRLQLGTWAAGFFFTIAVLTALLLLTAAARLLIRLVKIFVGNSRSYLWRQGFSNLYRPNNQTLTLVVSIGLSTVLICTLFFVQNLLIAQAESASGSQANMVLFNIQTGQEKAVAELANRHHLPVLQQVPVLSVRIEKVNGQTANEFRRDSAPAFFWLLNNEFRVTYRDSLSPNEKIVQGNWIGQAPQIGEVPVSFEERFATGNGLRLGDHLVFNIQGIQLPAKITSLRDVNWNRLQNTFPILFPKGVLERTPQTAILLTKTASTSESALFQRAAVRQFPNVSIIDLGFVLTILDEVLDKLDNIIRFMAMFSMMTGVVVLIASIHISKFQRIQESVLLRTMGASKRQLLTIAAIEYFFLGALSAVTGILIALAGSWSLAKFFLDIPFDSSMVPAILLFLTIAGITIIIGLFNSRGILKKPPLESLRKEV
jgi:putative ABC transport system permease protein